MPDQAVRQALADQGAELIGKLVERMDMLRVVSQLRELKAYNDEAGEKYPWMPSAWNTRV